MSQKSQRSPVTMSSTGWLLLRRYRPTRRTRFPPARCPCSRSALSGRRTGGAGARLLLCGSLSDALGLPFHDLKTRSTSVGRKSGRGPGQTPPLNLRDRCIDLGYRQMVGFVGGRKIWLSLHLREALSSTRIGTVPCGRLQDRRPGREPEPRPRRDVGTLAY
jgi:hypothetical protein